MGIQIYDKEGEGAERFTVVYLDDEPGRVNTLYASRRMSANPSPPKSPKSFTCDFLDQDMDKGRRIQFADLPAPCQSLVLADLEINRPLHPGDYDLTPEQLEEKYGPQGNQHPSYTRQQYDYEVSINHTKEDYWTWVSNEVFSEEDEFAELIDTGDREPVSRQIHAPRSASDRG